MQPLNHLRPFAKNTWAGTFIGKGKKEIAIYDAQLGSDPCEQSHILWIPWWIGDHHGPLDVGGSLRREIRAQNGVFRFHSGQGRSYCAIRIDEEEPVMPGEITGVHEDTWSAKQDD
jgi:hypothetical protein